MEKLIAELLELLSLRSTVDVSKVTVGPEGVYTPQDYITLAPGGVMVIDHHGAVEIHTVPSVVARALLIRITTDKEMLVKTAKARISDILNLSGVDKFEAADIRFRLEGNRAIIKTSNGAWFRINFVTHNVTKLINYSWIIQESDYASDVLKLQEELKGIIIQGNL